MNLFEPILIVLPEIVAETPKPFSSLNSKIGSNETSDK